MYHRRFDQPRRQRWPASRSSREAGSGAPLPGFLARTLAVFMALGVAPGAWAGALDAQQTGTIEGTVVHAHTGDPLVGAQVTVVGTQLRVGSAAGGAFRITNVPAGERQLRVSLIGFSPSTVDASVVAGQTVEVQVPLSETVIGLEEMTVTAFGEELRRRELGSVVGRINVQDVELAAVNTFSSLLQGRSAGVTVRASGGTLGTGSRIRIRGANSISLANDPLIVVDGVRLDNAAQSGSMGVGGQQFSRFEDINPNEIDEIEIVKGPAAAAMYGTAGANGVSQITTRRGQAGPAQWRAFVEQGVVRDPIDYPANWNAWWTDADGDPRLGCTVVDQAEGACQVDSLAVWNPLEETGALRTGHQQRYGLSVSGGGDDFTYFLSGEFADQEGVWESNTRENTSLRANFRTSLRDDMDLSVNAGYTTGTAFLPQNDNNLLGVTSGALLGRAFDGPGDTRGFVFASPEVLNRFEVAQQTDRLVGSLQFDWRPTGWLTLNSTLGMDAVERTDDQFVPPNTIFFGATLPTGQRAVNRAEIETYTWTFSGRTRYEVTPEIRASTGLTGEFGRQLFKRSDAFGSGLLPGTRSLQAASENFSVNELFSDVRTVGAALEQRFNYQDRIFVNLAVRADDDNSFGDRLDLVWYPAVSASWVLDEELWFPQMDVLSSLRARAAFGRSGLRPGFRDALFFFDPETVNVDGQNEPGFSVGGAGNPELRPEITTEWEMGVDLGLFRDRVALEATYFRKTSRDAFVARPLAPSLGATTSRFDNIGQVRNHGVEVMLNTTVVDLPDRFTSELTVSGSWLENELIDMGGAEPIIFGLGGDTQRHQEGYPLGGYWGQRLLDFEVGTEGLVDPASIVISDEHEFIGPSMPTREFSVTLGFQLFGLVRLNALFDHQGGHYLNNSTRFFRCGSAFLNCREAFDPSAPPEAQAQSMAAQADARATFIEKGDFTRFRELSATFRVPQRYVERTGAAGLSITLAGRNLATWTDYSGLDPEINFAGQANFSTAEFLTQPPLRHFTARVTVDF